MLAGIVRETKRRTKCQTLNPKQRPRSARSIIPVSFGFLYTISVLPNQSSLPCPFSMLSCICFVIQLVSNFVKDKTDTKPGRHVRFPDALWFSHSSATFMFSIWIRSQLFIFNTQTCLNLHPFKTVLIDCKTVSQKTFCCT